MPRTSGPFALSAATAAQIEATFTAANQVYKGTGSHTGALQDFGTVLNSQFGAAGQLFAGTGVGTGEKLATGTAGQLLTVGGADASGLEWSNPVNPALQYNDLLGWSFDPAIAGGSGSGQPPAYINLYRIPLPTPITITNLLICTHARAGVLLTHSYLALFKSNGTIVGQTADQSANFMANTYTLTTAALVGGPHAVSPLAANDFVWAALYIGTAGTMPTFQGDLGCNVMNAGVTAARARSGYIGQADTATLVSITPANINLPGSGNDIWMGIS